MAVGAYGQSFTSDLQEYRPAEGLRAALRGGALEFEWQGERGEMLRAAFTGQDGQPLVQPTGGAALSALMSVTPFFTTVYAASFGQADSAVAIQVTQCGSLGFTRET
jgi:hypothetical protein